jgi:hypothetical protein
MPQKDAVQTPAARNVAGRPRRLLAFQDENDALSLPYVATAVLTTGAAKPRTIGRQGAYCDSRSRYHSILVLQAHARTTRFCADPMTSVYQRLQAPEPFDCGEAVKKRA